MSKLVLPIFLFTALICPPGRADYIGSGARALANDPTSPVVFSQFELAPNVSVRPAFILPDELRLPVTLDIQDTVFIGAGAAYGVDDTNRFDPMVTLGMDIELSDRVVLNVTTNTIFQSGDIDQEFFTGIGYRL